MELTAALQKLDQLQRKQLAYSHAMGLIDYDGMTGRALGHGRQPRRNAGHPG